jgi:glycosyltransferase involved in cell wall biosynthesis
MELVVSLEHRFDRTPDGAVWTQTMFAYPFWLRYLEIFDRLKVVARVRDVPTASGELVQANGSGVSFSAIPYYIGPLEYMRRIRSIQRAARNAVQPNDAVIMRAPSQIATCIAPLLQRTGHPYGMELVGDPYDVFAADSVHHPLRRFFRWWFPRQMRQQCAHACAAAYVTEGAIQRRYPPAPSAFATACSDVELPDAAFASAPRRYDDRPRRFRLISVGSLAQPYKGIDVLIEAMRICVRQGMALELIVVGDGKYRADLEALALSHGLGPQIQFVGQLTAGASVRAQLDQADLFVMPSKTEGLPRAMIEAMARALPCVGTQIGGIPELLPAEHMVPPGDVAALARAIRELVADPQRLTHMSARNLEQAHHYREDVLQERRRTFYRAVRAATEAWQVAHNLHRVCRTPVR